VLQFGIEFKNNYLTKEFFVGIIKFLTNHFNFFIIIMEQPILPAPHTESKLNHFSLFKYLKSIRVKWSLYKTQINQEAKTEFLNKISLDRFNGKSLSEILDGANFSISQAAAIQSFCSAAVDHKLLTKKESLQIKFTLAPVLSNHNSTNNLTHELKERIKANLMV
jgi:hypothetical protein